MLVVTSCSSASAAHEHTYNHIIGYIIETFITPEGIVPSIFSTCISYTGPPKLIVSSGGVQDPKSHVVCPAGCPLLP